MIIAPLNLIQNLSDPDPAIKLKAIASGTKATATTSPDNISFLALEPMR